VSNPAIPISWIVVQESGGGYSELSPPSAMSSSAETMRTASAVPSAKPTLSAKAIASEVPAVAEGGAEPKPEPRWVEVYPWSVGRIIVRVVVRRVHRRRSRLVNSRRWRRRHNIFGGRWHRSARIGWRNCTRIVRSSKLLAVAIPRRLVGPNIAGGGMASPDVSRGRTCGHSQQPNAEENGYQSCHILPVMTAAVIARMSGVREMAAMLKVFAVSTKAKAEPQSDRGRNHIGIRRIRI
jgi:hypothetical protein